ncbi:DUF4469 domain-containing protein [Breznakiellaceae bacterium SP9]
MIDYYLKPNELIENSTDYTAVVFQSDIVTEAEMALDISQTIGGITEGQVAMVIDVFNKRVGMHLAAGRSVKTGIFSTTFSIGGAFPSADAEYNPAVNTTKVHVHLNQVLAKAALSAKKLKHTGIVNGGPVIDAVIDLSTSAPNATLHPGNNARIVGTRLKLIGDSPTVGISFINAAGEAIPLDQQYISLNNPKTLTFIVPALPDGEYTVQVTTQYSGGAVPAKKPHSFTFPTPLTVVNG